jgi:hypothetical protein
MHTITEKVTKNQVRISGKEVRASIRLPLPKQTGGRHRDRRDVSRQKQRIALRRGED